MTLILGTAQWGLDYGVTNAGGRIDDATLTQIVTAARAAGMDRLDTAASYGDAEERIAQLLPQASAGLTLQTKISTNGVARDDIVESVRVSLARLQRESIDAVLVHDWHDLDADGQANTVIGLESARVQGLVARIGISGYDAVDLHTGREAFATHIGAHLDIVQLPVSVLDQRLIGSPEIEVLREQGTEIQARSIFLQGLLLTSDLEHVMAQHSDIRRFQWACHEHGTTPIAAALGFVRTQGWIDALVIAPTTVPELSAIIQAWQSEGPDLPWEQFASTDVALLDPRRWPPREDR